MGRKLDAMRKLMARFNTLPIGTEIAAATDFGPVIKEQWGIVTGHQTERGLLWRKTMYLCTFLGGISVTASRAQIIAVQHGHSLRALEDPFWFLHSRGLADRTLRHEAEVRRYISRTQ